MLGSYTESNTAITNDTSKLIPNDQPIEHDTQGSVVSTAKLLFLVINISTFTLKLRCNG